MRDDINISKVLHEKSKIDGKAFRDASHQMEVTTAAVECIANFSHGKLESKVMCSVADDVMKLLQALSCDVEGTYEENFVDTNKSRVCIRFILPEKNQTET